MEKAVFDERLKWRRAILRLIDRMQSAKALQRDYISNLAKEAEIIKDHLENYMQGYGQALDHVRDELKELLADTEFRLRK